MMQKKIIQVIPRDTSIVKILLLLFLLLLVIFIVVNSVILKLVLYTFSERLHTPPRGVTKRRCGLLPNYFEHFLHFHFNIFTSMNCASLAVHIAPDLN